MLVCLIDLAIIYQANNFVILHANNWVIKFYWIKTLFALVALIKPSSLLLNNNPLLAILLNHLKGLLTGVLGKIVALQALNTISSIIDQTVQTGRDLKALITWQVISFRAWLACLSVKIILAILNWISQNTLIGLRETKAPFLANKALVFDLLVVNRAVFYLCVIGAAFTRIVFSLLTNRAVVLGSLVDLAATDASLNTFISNLIKIKSLITNLTIDGFRIDIRILVEMLLAIRLAGETEQAVPGQLAAGRAGLA